MGFIVVMGGFIGDIFGVFRIRFRDMVDGVLYLGRYIVSDLKTTS